MTSTSNPNRGKVIASGSIALSFVPSAVAFEVTLINVDGVVSDRTVTLLTNYKAESKQIYLMMIVSNFDSD